MKLDDLFRCGVTPNTGEEKGKRFKVLQVDNERVFVRDWDDEGAKTRKFAHGTYEIWQPPKSVFDTGKAITWGELKKAAEQEKLSDDTEFFVVDSSFFGGYFEPACAKLRNIHGKKTVVIY